MDDLSALKEYRQYCERQRHKFMLLGQTEIAFWWRNERIAADKKISDIEHPGL